MGQLAMTPITRRTFLQSSLRADAGLKPVTGVLRGAKTGAASPAGLPLDELVTSGHPSVS